mgnify:CR=1 FL=1
MMTKFFSEIESRKKTVIELDGEDKDSVNKNGESS